MLGASAATIDRLLVETKIAAAGGKRRRVDFYSTVRMERAQNLFPWLIRGADFDNDRAFMNDVVVPWCRAQKIEVTRSRAYKKNDQALVEQKDGAVVRRLVGYGRFDGIEKTRVLERLYLCKSRDLS